MSNATIQLRAASNEARQIIHSFVSSFAGNGGPYAPYVRGIKLRVGMVALACVQEAFLEKSAGGTGEDGIKWKPLTKQTVANRALGAGDRALLRGYGAQNGVDSLGRIKRGFLTPAQDKRWREIYGTRKASMIVRFGMDDGAADERAAQIAWAILKQEGAKTKLDILGSRKVEIGRDSGRLFNSLACGVPDPEGFPLLQEPPVNPDQILRVEPSGVVIGSNVEYAEKFHLERPLWPAGDLPAAWQERLLDAVKSGLEEMIDMIRSNDPGHMAA